MPRRSNAEMSSIENAIKQLMNEEHVDGPNKLKDRLKEKYGLDISKQTAFNLYGKYKNSITTNTTGEVAQNTVGVELEYEDNPEIVKINERIKKLEKDFDNATSATDRQKFNAALNDTQESKLKLKKILREAEMLKRNSDKQQWTVTFGTPEVIKTDIVKKPFFKAGDGQKTIPIEGGEE